jgi:hypothetical protein
VVRFASLGKAGWCSDDTSIKYKDQVFAKLFIFWSFMGGAENHLFYISFGWVANASDAHMNGLA